MHWHNHVIINHARLHIGFLSHRNLEHMRLELIAQQLLLLGQYDICALHVIKLMVKT